MAQQVSQRMRDRHEDAARQLRSEGLTTDEIGERLGISGTTVWRLLTDGVPERRRSAEQKAADAVRARELRESGLYIHEIGAEIGTTNLSWICEVTSDIPAPRERSREELSARMRLWWQERHAQAKAS